MGQADRFGQILVERQVAGDRPADLGDLEHVSQPGDVVVPLRVDEYLCLVFEPAERLRMHDTVPITLERGPVRIVELGEPPPTRIGRAGRRRCEHLGLGVLGVLPGVSGKTASGGSPR